MGQGLCRSGDKPPDDYKSQVPKNDKVVRFFMAGMGSAGKSTIIRHLKYLCTKNSNYKYCNEDWSEKKDTDECDNELWKNAIRENIINVFDVFIKHVAKNGDSFETEELEAFAKSIEHLYANKEEIPSVEMSDLFRENLINLLNDPAFKKVWAKKNKIDVNEAERKPFDGLDYFMKEEKLKQVFFTTYVPSEEDRIHSRLPTVEVQRYYFMLNKIKIEIYDAGGQASERARLLSYLSRWHANNPSNNRNFILFVASLADYNVKHPQYEHKTSLDEAVAFLEVLLNNDYTRHCGLLLFLNKKDRFIDKISDELCREDIDYIADSESLSPSDISNYKVTGRFDKKKMMDAAASKFVKMMREKYQDSNSYLRYTCAIDAQIMETFFSVIKNEILSHNLMSVLP